MADVHLQAAIERRLDHLVHLALAVDEAAGVARERMREDVARPEFRDHALEDRVCVLAIRAAPRQAPELAEVDIDRQVGLAADLRRQLQHLDAPAREAADLGMALDAADDIGVGLDGVDRRLDVDAVRAVEVRIKVSFEPADQIRRQERIDAGLRRVGDEMPEARQRHAGRSALIDHRGDAGMHADQVGIEAEAAADIAIDMGVGVDHAGKDDAPAQVDRLFGARRQNVLLHGGDLAVAHRDIHHAVHARGRADHMAAAQQQVIGFVVGHGRSPSSASLRCCAEYI